MDTAVQNMRKLDWMGTVIAPLSIIFMEILWIYPWLIWTSEKGIFTWARISLTPLSLFMLIAVPYVITRFIPARGRVSQLAKLALLLLNIVVIIHIEFVTGIVPLSGEWFGYLGHLIIESFSVFHPIVPALTVSVYLCWRGIRLGNTTSFTSDAFRSFMFGFIATVMMIIIWTMTLGKGSIESGAWGVGLYVAGFFFFGLISLALGNYLNIRLRLQREQSTPLSSRRMLVLLVVIIGGIVVIGMGVAGIFSPTFVESITGFFGNIFHYVDVFLGYLAIPMEWCFNVLANIMAYIISLLSNKLQPEEVFGFDVGLEGAEELQPLSGTEYDLVLILKWVSFVIIVAVIVWVLIRAARRFRVRDNETGVEEFSESLWSWLGFKADIRLFFSRLFSRWFSGRFDRIKKGISIRTARKEIVYPDDMDIREIYRHILEETSSSYLRHYPYETPYEYAGRLDTVMHDIDNQMDDITDLYVNVRYGESKLKEWETEHANVMFRLFRALIHKPDDKPTGSK